MVTNWRRPRLMTTRGFVAGGTVPYAEAPVDARAATVEEAASKLLRTSGRKAWLLLLTDSKVSL